MILRSHRLRESAIALTDSAIILSLVVEHTKDGGNPNDSDPD
ncbi:MAG: hypothetical protein AAFV72_14680 [Cyanobacteria bacterium J06635_1]